MIETSEKYKQAIYAPTRMVKARVRLEVLDKTAFQDNTKIATSEASISRKSQLTNKIRKMSNNYATFEKDYTKLDGSFKIPPKTDELPDDELGWWSDTLCDDTGTFNPYQIIEFDFNTVHSSMGLTIYFDILNDEHASDFDIDIYDADDSLIVHESFEGNIDTTFVYVNQLSNYKKVIVTIKKWCKPYRRAKIVEVDFGIIKVYEDKNLIGLNLIQELDITSSTIPASELEATIDNSDKSFDVLNPQGFYEFLKQGQEMFLEMGPELDNGEFEFAPAGKFYLKEWQSNPSSESNVSTITFAAKDAIDNLTDDEVENATVQNISLYDLAAQVLTACGITNYILNDNLKNIYTKGLYQKISYRNLLQLIAIAGMCIVYCDNMGKLHMEQLISAKDVMSSVDVANEAAISNKNQIINNVINPSFNVATFEKDRILLDGSFKIPQEDMSQYETGWISEDLSGEDNTFSTPQIVTLTMSAEHSSTNFQILFDTINNEYATDFGIQAYDADSNLIIDENITGNNQSIYLYQNNLLADSRKIIIAINKWSKPYHRARIVEIGFDLPLDNITFENMYAVPKISFNQAVKAVEVTYYPDDTLNTKAIYTVTDNSIEKGTTLKIDNSLINTEADAQSVAEWILRASQKTANLEVNWRQNPALCLADKVSVEDSYGRHNIGNIIKQQLDYQGFLRGTTNILGAV